MQFRHRVQHHWLCMFAWMIGSILPLAACLSGGGDDTAPVPPAVFVNLGFLPGYTSSQAVAVAGDGSVVVGTASTVAGNRQAFRWTAQEGLAGLGFVPTGTHSSGAAVSANGSVILVNGDSTSVPPTPAGIFRWTADGGYVRLDSPINAYLCNGAGVSGDGVVVVGTCLQFNSEAFRWMADATPIGLGRFGDGSDQTSTASAISVDGTVIVGAGHPVLTGAVMWNASGVATVLGKLPADASAYASAVSRDGAVIIGTSVDSAQIPHAFHWTRQAGMEALGANPLGVSGSVASGVSGDGTTIVGWGSTNTGETALIWDAAHGCRQLLAALRADYRTEIPGWMLDRATAISDDGHTIAGYGTNPQGQTEAWILKLPD